jgi:hypothetical protein
MTAIATKTSRVFARRPHDFYATPGAAVQPLLPHLAPHTDYIEPCAGDGALIRALGAAGHSCVYACDIEPRGPVIDQADVLSGHPIGPGHTPIITNPPWTRLKGHYSDPVRSPLPCMIREFVFNAKRTTWLLLDAGFAHTGDLWAEFGPYCERIVSVGRVKWIAESKSHGQKDVCWYKFRPVAAGRPIFFGKESI